MKLISTIIFSIISSLKISHIYSFLIVFTVIYVTQFYYRYFTRINPLPGPFPLPIIGSAYSKLGYEYNDWLKFLHNKYGDMLEYYLIGQRFIILGRADLVENMIVPSTKTKYPTRRHLTDGVVEYGIKGGANSKLFKHWKYNRHFFTQAMSAPGFNEQAIEWSIESWEQMESHWNALGENRELDLTKWIRRFTNDIMFRISIGTNVNSITCYYNYLTLEENDSLDEKEKEKVRESERCANAVKTYMNGMVYFVIFGKFIRRFAPFIRGKVKYYEKNRDYLFNRIYNMIKQRRIEIENTPLDQPLSRDMLTSNITANTSRDVHAVKQSDPDLLKPLNDEQIFDNMLDILNGGIDISASTFCFFVYHLEHYPEVKKRAMQELETVFGKDLTKPITFKDLEELKYFEAVVRESYRHYPIAFMTGRVNCVDDTVGGYKWPEGTAFSMSFIAIMNHKDYWTDPEKFDPDRFYKVEENDKYLRERQHIKGSFLMFGGGLRLCPGRKLAMIELKCLFVLIYRKYNVELVDMNAPLKYKSHLLTSCKELFIKAKPRKF